MIKTLNSEQGLLQGSIKLAGFYIYAPNVGELCGNGKTQQNLLCMFQKNMKGWWVEGRCGEDIEDSDLRMVLEEPFNPPYGRADFTSAEKIDIISILKKEFIIKRKNLD